jgi:serralysin
MRAIETALGAVDTIAGFSHRDDTIDLDNAIFARLKQTGVLKSKFFHVGKHAADHNDFIDYNKKTGALFYDADGSRHKFAPVEFAQLDAHLHLKHGDLLVV